MKKYLYGAIGFIAMLIITYLAISFCNLTIDPTKWDAETRFGFVIVGLFLAVVTAGIISNTFDKETKVLKLKKETEELKTLGRISKDSLIDNIHRPNNHELVGRVMSEGIDLSKLSKEDFKNL